MQSFLRNSLLSHANGSSTPPLRAYQRLIYISTPKFQCTSLTKTCIKSNCQQHYIHISQKRMLDLKKKHTSLGATRDDKVMDFSGIGPGLLLEIATTTIQSPEGTAFTLALYHPACAAIFNGYQMNYSQ